MRSCDNDDEAYLSNELGVAELHLGHYHNALAYLHKALLLSHSRLLSAEQLSEDSFLIGSIPSCRISPVPVFTNDRQASFFAKAFLMAFPRRKQRIGLSIRQYITTAVVMFNYALACHCLGGPHKHRALSLYRQCLFFIRNSPARLHDIFSPLVMALSINMGYLYIELDNPRLVRSMQKLFQQTMASARRARRRGVAPMEDCLSKVMTPSQTAPAA